MNDLDKDFLNFCQLMHNENCRERTAYNEKPYEFTDYVKGNLKFLKTIYEDNE